MIRSTFEVKFRVTAETIPGDVLFVVGDCDELGHWRPQKAKPLGLERVLHGHSEVWSRSLQLRLPNPVLHYRFFIGSMEESEGDGDDMQVMVRVWETNLKPRQVNLTSASLEDVEDPAIFGTYGGKKCIDRGWLSGQTEIHIRFHSNPINMWRPRHRSGRYRIKCNPIDLRYNDVHVTEDDDSVHDLPSASLSNRVLVSVLDGTHNKPADQEQFGTVYNDNDYIVFRAQTFTPESLGFQFDFYLESTLGQDSSISNGANSSSTGEILKLVGSAYTLPVNLKHFAGHKFTPIVGTKQRPIGELSVEYLIISPIKNYECDMKVSFAKHWKAQRRALDVAHRGMGNSYTAKECAYIPENTIESLSEAANHGADFVEFDIQLSKDKVPVVYHDFCASLTLRKRNQSELEWFDIPIQDLNHSQLQMLKLDHVSEKSKGSPTTEITVHPEDRCPFPTLRQCLEKVDSHTGFNIEIKYCMQLKSGQLEGGIKHYMERNAYLDIILHQLLPYCGDRRIVFSSFDPDICTMLRVKQNRYPVLFLCMGTTTKYDMFADPRTQNTPVSCHYACADSILGVNAHAEDLLRDPSLITQAKNMGLIVFCWGDDNNDKDTISFLKQQGVDGVIYDRIYELKHSKENVFKMEHEAKLSLLCNMGAIDMEANASKSYSVSPQPKPDATNSNSSY